MRSTASSASTASLALLLLPPLRLYGFVFPLPKALPCVDRRDTLAALHRLPSCRRGHQSLADAPQRTLPPRPPCSARPGALCSTPLCSSSSRRGCTWATLAIFTSAYVATVCRAAASPRPFPPAPGWFPPPLHLFPAPAGAGADGLFHRHLPPGAAGSGAAALSDGNAADGVCRQRHPPGFSRR